MKSKIAPIEFHEELPPQIRQERRRIAWGYAVHAVRQLGIDFQEYEDFTPDRMSVSDPYACTDTGRDGRVSWEDDTPIVKYGNCAPQVAKTMTLYCGGGADTTDMVGNIFKNHGFPVERAYSRNHPRGIVVVHFQRPMSFS